MDGTCQKEISSLERHASDDKIGQPFYADNQLLPNFSGSINWSEKRSVYHDGVSSVSKRLVIPGYGWKNVKLLISHLYMLPAV